MTIVGDLQLLHRWGEGEGEGEGEVGVGGWRARASSLSLAYTTRTWHRGTLDEFWRGESSATVTIACRLTPFTCSLALPAPHSP